MTKYWYRDGTEPDENEPDAIEPPQRSTAPDPVGEAKCAHCGTQPRPHPCCFGKAREHLAALRAENERLRGDVASTCEKLLAAADDRDRYRTALVQTRAAVWHEDYDSEDVTAIIDAALKDQP